MKALIHFYKIIPALILLVFNQNQVYPNHLIKPDEPGPWPSIQVNTFTGNLFHQRNDLHIPAQGEIPLDLTFSYNSLQNQKDLGYGNGWSFSFGLRYSISGNTLTIMHGDGEVEEYTWNGSEYEPPVGVYSKIIEVLPMDFIITTKYGIKYYFNDPDHKQLTKIEDPNGNMTIFSYTAGKLTTITDPSGRLINLSWSGNHLMQITDPNTTPDRVILFQYDGSWNMVQVTRPLSNIFQYGYDVNGNMTSVTDPRGSNVTVTYDINKAVAGISCPAVSYAKLFVYDNCDNTTTVSQSVSSITRQTIYTFDLTGRVISKQFPDGNSDSYTWDSMNNLSSFTDENGDLTLYTYDTQANILSKTDCLGNTESFTYEAIYNKPASFTSKNGHVITYSYDPNGNLIDLTDCLSNSISYTYDASGNLATVTDENGFTTTYSYDIYGNSTSILDPPGFTESNTFDPVGNILTSTDKRGFTTIYTYDLLDRHTVTVDALGYTSSYSYDGKGNLVSETNPGSFTTIYAYDAVNRLITKTDGTGGITSYTYDEAGNLLTETNARGCPTSYSYDSRDRKASLIDPLSHTETYTYDPAGNMLSLTDKSGNTTNYTYDCIGRLTMITHPDGFSETSTYNPVGKKTSLTDKNGNTTFYGYDCHDRLTSTIYPLGYSEINTYDAAGRKTSFTDKNGNITTYAYDAMGRLINRTDPLLLSELSSYDGNGNKTSSTDKSGNTTTYAYDNINRRISMMDPLGFIETYSYDNSGNRISLTDKRGYTTLYAYDGLNRKISTTDPLGYIVSYTYDLMSNQTSTTDKNGNTTSYIYDCNDQQISLSDPITNIELYSYSPVGNVTGATDKNGHTTSWTYSCCRLLSKTDPLGYAESYTYDPNGNKLSFTNRNGQVTNYMYDGLDRLISKTTQMGHLTQYAYDGFGNMVSKTDANLNTIVYSYNDRNELVTKTYPDASSINYTYDNRGNLTQTTNTGGIGETVDYTYDALDRLITKVTDYGSFSKSISYTYDNNGNCTGMALESGTISYQYDAANRLIQITDQNSGLTTFEYDGAGNQTALNYPNAVTTYSTYDALNRVTEVISSDVPPPLAPVPVKTKTVPSKSDEVLLNIDISVQQIISPVSGPGLTAAEPVTIQLINFGIIPVFNAVARYSIDGGAPVIQNVPQPLFPGNPVPFTFTQPADLSIPGHTYNLQTCVTVTGDENPANDCMSATVTNEPDLPTVYQSFEYQYDAVGNKIFEFHEDASSINYSFSWRNELLSESYLPSGDLDLYTYTPTGKRASKYEPGDLSIYNYNMDDILISAGSTTFTPDNNGNRIIQVELGGPTTYSYGYENELKHVTLPNLYYENFDYSAMGRPLKKNKNGVITYFNSDGSDMLEEYNSAGTSGCYYNPQISIDQGSSRAYLYYDGFGSSTLEVDPSLSIFATADFDAYGNIRDSSGSWLNTSVFFNLNALALDIHLIERRNDFPVQFADPNTADIFGNRTGPEKGNTEVTEPKRGSTETVQDGKKTDDKKKGKCCGVKKFVVKWSKPDPPLFEGHLFRLDVEIEFMDDDEHDPACCEYCQYVSTVANGSDSKGKWRVPEEKGKRHDDGYSRTAKDENGKLYDYDGKPELSDPGFETNDNPGGVTNDDTIENYSFTADQAVIEICPDPCPTGKVVAKRGPHTATVKGKHPKYEYTGVPITIDK